MSALRLPLAMALLLAACSSAEDDQVAADSAARSVIANVIGPDYAGVTLTPVIDCIMDTTPDEETNLLVAAAVSGGVTGSVTAMVRRMEQRPATRSCIAAKGVVKPRPGGI